MTLPPLLLLPLLLPLQISQDSHVGQAMAAAESAFKLLRAAKRQAEAKGSALFELEPAAGQPAN